MFVCIHACIHACICMCMYVCMHACMHVCVCMFACMHVCIMVKCFFHRTPPHDLTAVTSAMKVARSFQHLERSLRARGARGTERMAMENKALLP